MSKDKKIKEFLKKHKPLTPEDVKKRLIEKDMAIDKYQKDIRKVEENLVNFLNKEDPLVDPSTNKVIAWLRRLPYKELTEILPSELPEDFSIEEGKKYIEPIFVLMEKMISKPKHTAEEWKSLANTDFVELFNARVAELSGRIEEQTSFF